MQLSPELNSRWFILLNQVIISKLWDWMHMLLQSDLFASGVHRGSMLWDFSVLLYHLPFVILAPVARVRGYILFSIFINSVNFVNFHFENTNFDSTNWVIHNVRLKFVASVENLGSWEFLQSGSCNEIWFRQLLNLFGLK